MNRGAGKTFRQQRREIDKKLSELLEGLDREHYPAPLRESLFAVLMAEEAPRGLPLLLEVISRIEGYRPSANTLAAFECCLRAFLLLAEIGLGDQGIPAEGVGKKLGATYSRAQVLLTADTLLTWPLELTAAENCPDGRSLPGELAAALGAGGCLAALDRAGAGFDGLLELDLVERLCRAWAGREEEIDCAAAKWIYLRELSCWFSSPLEIGRALGKLEDEMSIDDLQQADVMELISFLKA